MSGTEEGTSTTTEEKLVFLANALAALSTALGAIAVALRMSKRGDLATPLRNEVFDNSTQPVRGANRDYWSL